MKRGILITFEGPEGSGKSTHIQLVARYLEKSGHAVTMTREPGGTPWSQRLRRALLDTPEDVTPIAELLLYEADRAQHVQQVILPKLRRGDVVLCDRYTDSTIAYQGFGRKMDPTMIRTLNTIANQGRQPDLTILLDVNAAKGLRQAHSRKGKHDRLERAGSAFHERVRAGFLTIARREPRRVRIVKQQATVGETQDRIRNIIDQFLGRKVSSASPAVTGWGSINNSRKIPLQ